MAGFVRRNFNSSNNTSKSGGTYKSSTISFLSSSYDDNNNFVARIKGINDSDIPGLNKIRPDIFKFKMTPGYIITLTINGDKIDEFENIIDDVKEEFKKLGYKPISVGGAFTALQKSISQTPTKDEIEQNNKLIANNWKELLTNLNDPEIRKRLLMFQTKYIANIPELKHLKLSNGNIAEILSSDPLASFVTSADNWEKYFDRIVSPNAQYIIITKPEDNTDWSSLYKDPAIARMGKANGRENWKAFVKLHDGERAPIVFNLKKKYNKARYFFKTKVVDIRFTKPKDPNNDKFMKVINLANNLTGELNQVAKNALMSSGYTGDVNAKKVGAETNEDLLQYKDFILDKCKSKKITIHDQGDIKEVISDAIFEYAKKIASGVNKLSPKIQHGFACGVCYAIATTFNIQSNRVSSCIHFFQTLSKDEASFLAMDIFNTYRNLVNISLNENIMDNMHIMSFDELRDSLVNMAQGDKENLQESTGNKFHIMSFDELHNSLLNLAGDNKTSVSEIKENFNNFMERMNNVPK